MALSLLLSCAPMDLPPFSRHSLSVGEVEIKIRVEGDPSANLSVRFPPHDPRWNTRELLKVDRVKAKF
jgi:hypothetical protein